MIDCAIEDWLWDWVIVWLSDWLMSLIDLTFILSNAIAMSELCLWFYVMFTYSHDLPRYIPYDTPRRFNLYIRSTKGDRWFFSFCVLWIHADTVSGETTKTPLSSCYTGRHYTHQSYGGSKKIVVHGSNVKIRYKSNGTIFKILNLLEVSILSFYPLDKNNNM